MLGLFGQLLGLIPGLASVANNFITKHFDAQVQEIVAKTGAQRDIAVAVVQMQQATSTRWWFVAVIPPMFALPYVVYTWKCVVWDTVLGYGETPSLGGTVATVYLMVVAFYFAQARSAL